MTRAPETILDEVRLFQKSRGILTAAALDLFTLLHSRPATAADISSRIGADARGTTRLLDALIVFGLLEKEAGVYRVTEAGACLSSAHPKSVLPMVLHMNTLWDRWSRLTDAVRAGGCPGGVPAFQKDDEALKAFIGAMHVVGRAVADEVAASCAPERFRRLLDVGGGSGVYTIAFLRRNPALTAALFDRPGVIPMARARIAEEGLEGRVELVAGDFEEDDLPLGFDVALLSAIIHQNSPAQNVTLFRKVHRALVPGGAVLVRDHVMDEERTSPPAGALFALNMLVGTEGGDTYTFREIEEALGTAGFEEVRSLRTGERMEGLVEARKPGVPSR